ncbi:MAG: heme o synthase [Acidobacteriaceae bacterium]|nr:heme o synthase [Acidobacteriaceae bacterium]
MSATATSSATAVPHPAETRTSLLGDYTILFKPRVSAMVLLTAAGGFYFGCLRSGINPFSLALVHMLIGVTIVTCGSGALNQALERATDRLMPRTASRPMAQHRIGLAHGLILGCLLTALGSTYLVWQTNLLAAMLTLITAVGYVAIYTPLKRITTLNTFIGAFPGALPPLIGWAAARDMIEWRGIALFAILFVWQFPHFMAIGWLYRNDYKRAGIRITATREPAENAARATALQSLFYAVLMVPVAMWPTWLHMTGVPYEIAACVLSLYYLYAAIRFLRIIRFPNSAENRTLARQLLRVSVIYLPLLLLAMMLNAKGHLPLFH